MTLLPTDPCSNAQHGCRNSLNAILGLCIILRDNCGRPEELPRIVEQLKKQAVRGLEALKGCSREQRNNCGNCPVRGLDIMGPL